MTDVNALVQAARPGPAIDIGTPTPGAIRSARQSVIEDHAGRQRDPEELSANPGSPGYRSKIPNPPCAVCGQDHNPMHEAQGRYTHIYVHPRDSEAQEVLTANGTAPLPDGVTVQPVSAAAVASIPATVAGAPAKRMTLFPGKQDDSYLLIVEERVGDDWEDVKGFVLANTLLSRVLPIFDLLGLKIKDRTGGDLVMLRNPNDAG